MKIFGIKNCDKIKKTILWCASNGRMCEFHDYRVDGIDEELLNSFLGQYSLEELVNKRSTTWRTLSDNQKNNLNNEIIIANPTLLKRPIVEIEGQFFIGFFPKKWG
ncbi:MAG: arsenate reductase [Proteobacteria bacterium]|nr:arsenate reductase [Pseudomonadota bacterium]